MYNLEKLMVFTAIILCGKMWFSQYDDNPDPEGKKDQSHDADGEWGVLKSILSENFNLKIKYASYFDGLLMLIKEGGTRVFVQYLMFIKGFCE